METERKAHQIDNQHKSRIILPIVFLSLLSSTCAERQSETKSSIIQVLNRKSSNKEKQESTINPETDEIFDFTTESSDEFDFTKEDSLNKTQITEEEDEFDFTIDDPISEEIAFSNEINHLMELIHLEINRLRYRHITPSKEKLRPKEFKKRFLPLALYVRDKYGIPLSLTLAQCALETKWGSSEMINKKNNAFGIKVHKSKRIDPNDKYQTYETLFDSFDEYGKILNNKKNQSLINRRKKLFPLDTHDYERYVHAIVKGGYAESKTYAEHLIDIIFDNWPNIDKEIE